MNKFTLLSTLIVLVCITGSQQKCTQCGLLTTQGSCSGINICQWQSGSCQAITIQGSCSSQNYNQCYFSKLLGQCVANTDSTTIVTSPCMDVPNPTASCTSQNANCVAYSSSTQMCHYPTTGASCAYFTQFTCSGSFIMSILTVSFVLLMIIMA